VAVQFSKVDVKVPCDEGQFGNVVVYHGYALSGKRLFCCYLLSEVINSMLLTVQSYQLYVHDFIVLMV